MISRPLIGRELLSITEQTMEMKWRSLFSLSHERFSAKRQRKWTTKTVNIIMTYKVRCNELTQYLNRRGYNVGFLNQKIQRVHTITRADSPTRIPLVAGYNPALP